MLGDKFNDDAIAVLISGNGGSCEASQRRVRRLTSGLRARGFEVAVPYIPTPPSHQVHRIALQAQKWGQGLL